MDGDEFFKQGRTELIAGFEKAGVDCQKLF